MKIIIILDIVAYVVTVYDADGEDLFNFSLYGHDSSFFKIDNNGVIWTVQELYKHHYSLTVVVNDNGGLNSSVLLGFYLTNNLFPAFEVNFFFLFLCDINYKKNNNKNKKRV